MPTSKLFLYLIWLINKRRGKNIKQNKENYLPRKINVRFSAINFTIEFAHINFLHIKTKLNKFVIIYFYVPNLEEIKCFHPEKIRFKVRGNISNLSDNEKINAYVKIYVKLCSLLTLYSTNVCPLKLSYNIVNIFYLWLQIREHI